MSEATNVDGRSAPRVYKPSLGSALLHRLRQHPMLLMNVLLLLGVCIAAYWRFTGPVSASSSAPAELFMRSVATEDGALGWQQLCPEMQAQLPLAVLEQQTMSQQAIQTQEGMTLSIDHVGDRTRPTGGEIRFYVATAHGANGSVGQATYVVKTQANGCVESVE